jgi:signal transduction histidine kinase
MERDDRVPINVLLVEDDDEYARLLRWFLEEAGGGDARFMDAHARRLAKAVDLLDYARFDVILLDLSLPDSTGLATLDAVHACNPRVPIVVLTGVDDEAIAMKAVQSGAQDYLIKSRVDDRQITRSIRYAIERKRVEEELARSVERLSLLRELGAAILANRLPEGIAASALPFVRQLIPCDRADVAIFDLAANEATVLAVDTENPTGLGSRSTVSLEDVTFPEGYRRGEASASGCIDEMAQIPEPLRLIRLEGMRSYVSVPLIYHDELIGALNVWSRRTDAFSSDSVDMAYEIARQLAVAVQNGSLLLQVEEGRRRLQLLSRRLMEVQEQERRHIARELHDEIGQALTATKIDLQMLYQLAKEQGVELPVDESMGTVELAMRQVREMSVQLRPTLLDDLGLASALRWYLKRTSERTGLVARLSQKGPSDLLEQRLPAEIETACFRVAQEALTNTMRHAQARTFSVELRRGETNLEMEISDDGVGFDLNAAREGAAQGISFGLLSMQERVELTGGRFSIEAAVGRGTRIQMAFTTEGKEGE